MARIHSRTLRCGTPLVVEHNDAVRSAALCWLVPGGSAFDPAHLEGRSTMWAEMLLRGAGNLDSRAHADALDRLGVGRSLDVGTYYMRLGATMLGEHLLEALPLLVDMVRRPRMEADDIEPARDLAMQALDSLKDDPQERAFLAARRRHHPAPINRSGLGAREGITALTHQDLVTGWKQVATPIGSIIGAAGAIDVDALAATLDRLLADWSGSTSLPGTGAAPPRGYEHEIDPANQVQIVICTDAPPEPDDASMLEKVVVNVLSGGMSGRLFSEVREKRGLCYSVSAGYRGDRTFGALTGYVGTTPLRAQDSLEVLDAELNRINTPAGRVTQAEFSRAIVGMKSRLVFSGESTAARASALAADMHIYARPRSLEELAAKVDAVTLTMVNDYLSHRSPGRVTIQTLGPAPLTPPTAAGTR